MGGVNEAGRQGCGGAEHANQTTDEGRCWRRALAPTTGNGREKPFSSALKSAIRAGGETCYQLYGALRAAGYKVPYTSLYAWRRGDDHPRHVESIRALKFIERRYGLHAGELKGLIPHQARAYAGHKPTGLTANERRRLAWHLPEDFNDRPLEQQAEIIGWARSVILTGSTAYRRYQSASQKRPFAIGFSEEALDTSAPYRQPGERKRSLAKAAHFHRVPAPPILDQELASLLRFKAAKITPLGFRRVGVWGAQTRQQKAAHLGLLFGALSASASGPIAGLGVPQAHLTVALLAFPKIWNWYIEWRLQRRGFHTRWESDMLCLAVSLLRRETGWLRQSPQLSQHLLPIPGILTDEEITSAQRDWQGACDVGYSYASAWRKDIKRVARVHRDTFEPILPVLEAESPVGVYNMIAEEIDRRTPDSRQYPLAAAEAVRSLLMIRLGLHTGLRQRNLRELGVRQRDEAPTPLRTLEALQRGELHWDVVRQGWMITIPAAAFKNAASSYFSDQPYKLLLPDVGNLYGRIEAYLRTHRAVLLFNAQDPGTFFVKTARYPHLRHASYCQTSFYEAWRHTIERYGVYNPYTGRGAIRGLLPHGPHNVRDVLATHVLKRTGSYEQAGYAIQDTAETVARYYARFLPNDKAAIAARILDEVWEAA